MPYDPQSAQAAVFIHHDEIIASINYAQAHCHNRTVLAKVLAKAAKEEGLNHREALLLLMQPYGDIRQEIFALAQKIKEKIYGKRIVLFAPLYLSNYCINSCSYCPYHRQNKQIERKQLSQAEIIKEVTALQDMGHKRLALEAGEDPQHASLDYVLESIDTIYSLRHKNGAIRRVNVNIAATSINDYKRLKAADIGTYILFQETYHRPTYEALHPHGPKSDYSWHTEAHDRAMAAGIDDVGLGVLFGLADHHYDFCGLLMHAEHLEARFGVGPHTLSVPRIQPASDIDPAGFTAAIDDDTFLTIVAVLRLAVPYTGMIISTRESPHIRGKALSLGISQISGASSTSVGGYTKKNTPSGNSAQFDINDDRPLDEVVYWLLQDGHLPSFCTACYRAGRTGEHFMDFAKTGDIQHFCEPNALLTLKEYLLDYASPSTKALGERMIQKALIRMPEDPLRQRTEKGLQEIEAAKRDVHF